MPTEQPDPDHELGLAAASWEAGDLDGLVAHLSGAIRGFTARNDCRAAALVCAQLGDVLSSFLGNRTAGRAWFARAMRLVADEPPCIEQGWVAVAAMGCDVDDPEALLAAAELALERARRFGDLNLEAKALADGGLARVRLGRLDEGMALLDEAMALVCGPVDDLPTASKSVCSFFTACYATADFGRAQSWNDLLRQHGLMGDQRGAPIYLRSHCDSLQAMLLVELGRWAEAEAVLVRSIADFERLNQTPSWHPAIALAELRVGQGRLAEAEELLLRRDAWLEGLLPAAQLHLARGEYELALAASQRGLRAVGSDRMRAAQLSAVEVDARLALGDLAGAEAAAVEMDRRTGALDLPSLRARNLVVRARLCSSRSDDAGAIAALVGALEQIDGVEVPWLRVTTLLELALHRERLGDRAGARLDAMAAARLLAGMDVVLAPRHVGALARLADTDEERSARPSATLAREGKWWTVAHGSTRARIPDSKGLQYVAALVERPGVERHALDLVDRVEGVAARGGVDRRSLGDAGEVLDSTARAAYRREIEALRAEIDEAFAVENLERAEQLQGELDRYVAQLAQAFGLGGRARSASSAAERARLNVTRALRSAAARIAGALPEAGAALDRHLRTGLYCCYDPPPEDAGVRWIVQS